MEYLNEQEKEKIARFMEDTVLVNALKKVLLEPIYRQGTIQPGEDPEPLKNGALALAFDRKVTNEELGADVKSFAQGVHHLETAFDKLATVKPTSEAKPKKVVNKGK